MCRHLVQISTPQDFHRFQRPMPELVLIWPATELHALGFHCQGEICFFLWEMQMLCHFGTANCWLHARVYI